MRLFCFLFFLLSQAIRPQQIPTIGNEIQDFIPEGWEQLSYAEGPLDSSVNLPYSALVIQTPTLGHGLARNRLLLVFSRSDSFAYHRFLSNPAAILLPGDGGDMVDPFCGLSISDNLLHLCFIGGSQQVWKKTFSFRLQHAVNPYCLFLVSYTGATWDRHTGIGVSDTWDYLHWTRTHSLLNAGARATSSQALPRSPFLVNLRNFDPARFDPDRFPYNGD